MMAMASFSFILTFCCALSLVCVCIYGYMGVWWDWTVAKQLAVWGFLSGSNGFGMEERERRRGGAGGWALAETAT